MTRRALMGMSERWFRLLLLLYPPDFQDEMGTALVEAYLDRARASLDGAGMPSLALLWMRALADSLRNGLGERLWPAVRWRRTGNWGRDIELVGRRLVRTPAFLAATLITLTVGLGMVAVVYTAVEKVLIAPLPYKDANDLYFVWRDYGPKLGLRRGPLAGNDIAALQRAGGVIERAVALQRFLGGVFCVREGVDPMEIAVTVTSPELFDVLGVKAAIGRGFAPNEIGPRRHRVIVLTHKLWTSLGADSALVGQDVHLNGRAFTVIGVLPADFSFMRNEAIGAHQRVDAFTTFETPLCATCLDAPTLSGLIRARRGASRREVEGAVAAVRQAADDERDAGNREVALYPVAMKTDIVARARPALVVLGVAGGAVALMLLVNLASVLLARAAQREHEFVVSRSLGADDVAVMRATLLEGAWLGLLGGALATAAAVRGTRELTALAPLDLPRRDSIVVDWQSAVVVMGAGLAIGLLAASVPALWMRRRSLSSTLAHGPVRGAGHSLLRRGLIVAQVAISLMLLGSGALVVESLERLLRADPGFKPQGLLSFLIRTPPEFIHKMDEVYAFHDRLQTALASIPGVTAASAASALPLTALVSPSRLEPFEPLPLTAPGALGNSGNAPLVDVIAVLAGYVEVMGMRVREGRAFETSRREGVREALIDQSLARQFFPGGSPLGAKVRVNGKEMTVVGVVDQARLYELHTDGRPQIYVRAEDWNQRPLFFVVRTDRDPLTVLPDVRAAVRHIDTRVAVGEARTMEQIVDDGLRQQRTTATLVTSFALGAVLLAAMGLYGVVAGAVTRRRHELAVRLALGADHDRVLRLALWEGASLVGLGALIGAPALYVAAHLLRLTLAAIPGINGLVVMSAVVGLIAVTLVTCYLPARRTLAIDPAQLLREA